MKLEVTSGLAEKSACREFATLQPSLQSLAQSGNVSFDTFTVESYRYPSFRFFRYLYYS